MFLQETVSGGPLRRDIEILDMLLDNCQNLPTLAVREFAIYVK